MVAAIIAFKFVNDRPVGHTEINCYLVFDVNMNFTCKAHYVAVGNLTDPPDNVPTYPSVVSCESVSTLFLISALYDIKALVADIINAFLNVQCAEYFFNTGIEFKSHKVLWVIIICGIYGLKSAGASFRAHLANTLRTMGFKPKFTERNVWMRKNFLPLSQ